MSSDWKALLGIAEDEVRAVIAALPAELKRERNVCLWFMIPERAKFLGNTICTTLWGCSSAPHIWTAFLKPMTWRRRLFFLENLWEFAEFDDATYRAEVRTTYLTNSGTSWASRRSIWKSADYSAGLCRSPLSAKGSKMDQFDKGDDKVAAGHTVPGRA